MTSIESVREQFPGLAGKVFLDAACVSLAPKVAADAVQRMTGMAVGTNSMSATENHIAMDELRTDARRQCAKLINANDSDIALVESTSHGLSIVADAIPLERGDRVLLCDLEFMQVAIPWVQKQKEMGIEIDVVANRDGCVSVDDFAARITPRTKVLTISSVQWSSGFQCDLAALGKLCRERGIFFVVDAIQQLGASPIDVRATPMDVLACGGHKWLNSPFGLGFLYIRRETLPKLKPPLSGYLSLATPEGGWGNYFQTPSIRPVREYRFDGGAAIYETGGTSNYPGAAALAASVGLINEIGTQAIAAHVEKLTTHLMMGLHDLGLKLVTPIDPRQRAGIVTFDLGSAERNVEMMEKLREERVLVSVRYTSHVGGVRCSCHFFNNEEDMAKLLAGVRKHVKAGAAAR